MSISALSTNLIADLSQQQRQNPFQQIKQDFQQLASALQSGDLQGAQSAYSNIQQVLGSNANSSGSGGSNTLQNDFATLGQALQSGDLTQAQSAFSQLQSDFQAGRQSGRAGAGAAAQAQDQYVSSASQAQNAEQTAQQDYTQIGQDLQAGDLTNAQSAYSNLLQLVQAYQGPSSSNTAIPSDFATLGQDLQAGNLTQSQSAFTQLQSDIQAATQNPVQQVQQDYTQLASALQSGNLTGAQSAFAALEQALQTQSGTSTPATAASNNSNDPIANDLNALGQALSSGNLTQAQSAFTQLNNDIQSAQQSGTSQAQSATRPQKTQVEGHHHHHHHGGGGGSSSSSSSQSSSSTTSAANSYTSSTSGSSVSVYA